MDLYNVSDSLADRPPVGDGIGLQEVDISDTNDTVMAESPCPQTVGNISNCSESLYYDGEMENYQSPFDLLSVRVVFICLYSIVFLLCFVGNLIVIIVVLKHRRMRTTTNFFLANLAVADFCVGIFCVLPNLSLYLCPYWILGRVMCKLYYFVQAMSYTASVNILTIISIERFFAIIYPLRSKQLATMCLLRLAVILVWVVAGAAGVPYLIFYDTVDIPNTEPLMTFCLAKDINQKAYATLNFLFGYVIPLALMTVMYSCISAVLWRSSLQMNFSGHSGGKRKAKKKNGDSGKVQGKLQGEQYEMNEPRHLVTDKTTTEEEHRKLMEKNSRRSNAARLLKRMDSSLSEDMDTNEAETDPDCETAVPKPYTSGSKSVIQARLNGMKVKPKRGAAVAVHHQPHTSGISHHVITKTNVKRTHLMANSRKQENALLARRRVIRLLIVVIVSFASCVLPYHIRVLWQTWEQPNPSFWRILISPITFVVYYLNSGLNPLFYAFLSDRFRECLLEVATCRDYRVRRRLSLTNRTMHSIA